MSTASSFKDGKKKGYESQSPTLSFLDELSSPPKYFELREKYMGTTRGENGNAIRPHPYGYGHGNGGSKWNGEKRHSFLSNSQKNVHGQQQLIPMVPGGMVRTFPEKSKRDSRVVVVVNPAPAPLPLPPSRIPRSKTQKFTKLGFFFFLLALACVLLLGVWPWVSLNRTGKLKTETQIPAKISDNESEIDISNETQDFPLTKYFIKAGEDVEGSHDSTISSGTFSIFTKTKSNLTMKMSYITKSFSTSVTTVSIPEELIREEKEGNNCPFKISTDEENILRILFRVKEDVVSVILEFPSETVKEGAEKALKTAFNCKSKDNSDDDDD